MRTGDKPLTKREMEILRLLAEEMTSKEIGETLNISYQTVNGYRKNKMNKMGARNIVGVILTAIEKGYLKQ